MEELFRFAITRPADRTNATTIPLEQQSSFQQELKQGRNEDWSFLESVSLSYIKENLSWIEKLISPTPDPPIPALQHLLTELQAIPSGSTPDTWQEPIQAAVDETTTDQLAELGSRLADLFLALLIIRAIGPAGIDRIVHQQNWVQRDAQILHDRPSLSEIANLLRVLDLFLSASIILSDSSPIQTVDDLQAALKKTLLLPPDIFSKFAKPIHAIGFTDLLVVKQHIARYEMGEVARIENILKGESRGHTQKHTLSNERDTTTETSTETETDQELTTTDHVSLQNEINNTLNEVTKIDAGAHVKYDAKPVTSQVDLTVSYNRSSSDSKKFASNIAKDITQKAVKKVTQKIQQTVTTKIIETFEETENQNFENKSGAANISGVYQWVEKVYLAQVFNYGKHLLFDIMVPEPAASLLQAANIPPPNQVAPVPPDFLGTITTDASGKKIYTPLRPDQLVEEEVDSQGKDVPNFYGNWVAKFQVTGVEAPPTETITVAKSFSENSTNNNVHLPDTTINIEDGYAAISCSVAVAWRSTSGDSDTRIDVIVGPQVLSWTKDTDPNGDPTKADADKRDFSGSIHEKPLKPDSNGQMQPLEERSIGIALQGAYCEEAAATIEVQCRRTATAFAKWQFQVYEKIVSAWQKLQSDYEEKLANFQYQKSTTSLLGTADPETNRQIERNELKRSCITLLANTFDYTNGIDALVPKDSSSNPVSNSLFAPDLTVAESLGSWVRWFEQAFEWDKIGYVFYPYYWGRPSQWIPKLNQKNDDPLFLNFLQAGYARVSIPVRTGFEDAINFFVLTGKPWLGGELPEIWDKGQNPLYLSITEEMKEQSGAPGNEKPVDEPWEIHLPTTLIRLRADDKLPRWKWDAPGKYPPAPPNIWTWEEDKANELVE